jgi:hypothetical protein
MSQEPEVRRALLFGALSVGCTVFQLLADTFISSIVGKRGAALATARGEVGTILGFAFYVFGALAV